MLLDNGKQVSVQVKKLTGVTYHFQNGQYILHENIADFLIDGNDGIMFNESEVYIFRIGGRDKIRVNLTKGLRYALGLDGTNEYLFVGDTYLERVRLVGEKK